MKSKWARSLLATTALVLSGSGAFAGEIKFEPVPFAGTDAQKRQVLASEAIEIDRIGESTGGRAAAGTAPAMPSSAG